MPAAGQYRPIGRWGAIDPNWRTNGTGGLVASL